MTSKAGMRVTVINTVSNKAILVYPSGTGKINGGSASAALSQTAGKNAVYYATDTTNWYQIISA